MLLPCCVRIRHWAQLFCSPFQPVHGLPQCHEHDQPCPKDDELPFFGCVMVQNSESSAEHHEAIFHEHRLTMAPPTQNQSLIIVLPMSFPDFFTLECPSN